MVFDDAEHTDGAENLGCVEAMCMSSPSWGKPHWPWPEQHDTVYHVKAGDADIAHARTKQPACQPSVNSSLFFSPVSVARTKKRHHVVHEVCSE